MVRKASFVTVNLGIEFQLYLFVAGLLNPSDFQLSLL